MDMHACLPDDEGYETDEKMLLDFHLGNAINLDIIEKIATGVSPKYQLHVPHFYSGDYRKLQQVVPKYHRIRVGFLNCTIDLLSLPSKPARFSPNVYKDILKIIGSGFESRGVKIPIVEHNKELCEYTVIVNASQERIFRRLLRGISMLSEKLRGGNRSVYPDVTLKDRFAIVDLSDEPAKATCYIGRNVSAIYTHYNETLHVGNYDSVLMLMDTIGQRICLDVGCQLTRITRTPGNIEANLMNTMIFMGDQILKIAGNDGYEIIGLFESSVVSAILLSNPDLISNGEAFHDNCMSELKDLCVGRSWGEEILNIWTEMIKLLIKLDANTLSNIFCIYRIWGHPRVDIYEGMKRVHDKGMMMKHSTNSTQKLVICQFRRMFLSSYLSKNRAYPNLIIPEKKTYVFERLRCGLPVDRYYPGFSIWDYADVKILQIWALPSTYDVCHILNDKAVSPNISEIHASVRSGKGTLSGASRRGIIRWMEGESIRCKDFLEKVDEKGLDDDSYIIGMYEKEREIKVKARMFSLMSEEMRMYFVLTEELIANHILPYFPEITMKDPLHVQLRKIWSVGGKGQHPLNPNINIDFEKWNLNMRDEFTKELFLQMDTMFGYSNLISRTHEIFKRSYIYSSSGKYLPKICNDGFITDPPMSYIGHLGGFEGLRQKGWTVATVCLLAFIAESMRLEMCLLGQGDNQVLKLYMPVSKWDNLCYSEEDKIKESKRLTNEYTHQMQLNFSDAGLPIKIRETWISTRLFMYGKMMYLDGDSLPQWSKKLLRSYALSNEGSVTISGVIGTIATNMSAAAGASTMPDIMYVLYLIMAEWSADYLLKYHPFTRETILADEKMIFMIPGYNKGRTMTAPRINYKWLIATLLTVPTAVGGSINIPLTSFIMRGFPDHAAEGYSWIKLLASVDSNLKIMYQNWYTFLQNPSIQADMLLQSPWSLNHLKPPTPGLQSREVVRQWMLSGRFERNLFLRNMREINNYFDRKQVCTEMLSDPMNPLISYEIYQGFPHSYYDSILRRFEGTRSVKKMAMQEVHSKPIIKKLMRVEHQYTGYLIWRSHQKGKMFSDCATEHTRMARDIGWGRKIVGLTTPHPLEFIFDKICIGFTESCDGTDHIYLRNDLKGQNPPYLGSKVKTKVISQQDEGARSEPLICTNARIARYINWLGVGKNLKSVVEQSTKAVCDIEIFDKFFDEDPYGEMYSGSVEHRFNPSAASEGCFINYSPQLGSSVMMSSDHMPTFGKGKANYTLHFQALYCFLQYIGASMKKNVCVHYHLSCMKCIVPVEDEIGDISDHRPGINLAFHPKILPRLVETIGEIKEKTIINLTPVRRAIPGDYVQLSDSLSIRNRSYYGVLLLLSVKCAQALYLRGHKQSEGLGTDDLQSFPRVYAYKLHTDHLIWTIARILIYLQALQSDESINTETLKRLKDRISKILLHSPLSKYKEVASLCLGRNLSKNQWSSIKSLSQGNFPETTTLFLRSIKHMLLTEVDNIGDQSREYQRHIIIPALNCSDKEHQILIGFLLSMHGCGVCMELPKFEILEGYPDCRFKHTKQTVSKVKLANTTLDRIMKIISIKNHIKHPTQCQFKGIPCSEQIFSRRKVEIALPIISEELLEINKMIRCINLPTSSIYKWLHILTFLGANPACVIVLGDGTGTTSYICAQVFSKSKIYPCSFIEGKRGIPQDLGSIRPGISRNLSNVSGALQESIPDDIFCSEWGSDFKNALEKMQKPILIVSDIETGGGSWTAQKVILDNIPINVTMILKMYGSELPKYNNEKFPSSSAIILSCPEANLKYGEFFLYLTSSYQSECLNFGVGLNKLFTHMKNNSDKSEWYKKQIEIEIQFHELREISIRLALDHIASKGLSLSKTILDEEPKTVLSIVINFINRRYRFPQDKIKLRDVRNLTDGSLDRLVRGLKIIILSMFHEDLLHMEWFRDLYLARCERKNRVKEFPHIKIVMIFDRFDRVPMTKKDIQAARILRHVNHMKHQKILNPPSSREFLQEYILQALSREPQFYFDAISLSLESYDDISDLSEMQLSDNP